MGVPAVAGQGQQLLAPVGHASSIQLVPQAWTVPAAQGRRQLLQLPFGDDSVGFTYVQDDDDGDENEHHRHWVAHPEQSLQVTFQPLVSV